MVLPMKRNNISIADKSSGGADSSASASNNDNNEYTKSRTEPKQKSIRSCKTDVVLVR